MAKLKIESEVAGNVWKIEVAVGDLVQTGDVLMILESMKMEIPVEAPRAGKVVEILVATEQAIDEGQLVAVLECGVLEVAESAG